MRRFGYGSGRSALVSGLRSVFSGLLKIELEKIEQMQVIAAPTQIKKQSKAGREHIQN